MLDQMRRPEAEGVALAYLAAWGLARGPGKERWKAGLGLFATTKQDRDVVRILPLPRDMELRHERDPAAIADAWLWNGSEAGSACHHLVLLGLRGALGAHGALVDRLRRVQGGQWQPVSWGTVHAQAIQKLAASQDGYRALRAMREVFDRARRARGDNAWEKGAHGLAGFLISPGIDSLGRFLRATAGALADEGRGAHVGLDEKAMGEVMKVSDAALYQLYCEESVKQVGRSLRQLLGSSESWQVYEAFVAAREANDLARAIHDLLREAVTANRSAQQTRRRTVWVPEQDVLPNLLQLADRYGAEAVGLAAGSYALARPTRRQPVEEGGEESLTPEAEVDS